jgi:hypothetical protein
VNTPRLAAWFACAAACICGTAGCTSTAKTPPRLPPAPTTGAGQDSAPAGADASDFTAAWPGIMIRLLSSDASDRRALTAPEHGLYYLDNPGAFLVLGHEPRLTSELHRRMPLRGCRLRAAEALPTFDCETDRWSARGCLHVPNASLPLVKLYTDQLRYVEDREPGPDDQARLQELREVERLITDAVFFRGVYYYFGVVDGAWRLLAVNLESPCSA